MLMTGEGRKGPTDMPPLCPGPQGAVHSVYCARLTHSVAAAQENVYDQEKVEWILQNCPTCIQVFEGLCKMYADRPMFGFCAPNSDKWQTITYKQCYERVTNFVAGAHACKLA